MMRGKLPFSESSGLALICVLFSALLMSCSLASTPGLQFARTATSTTITDRGRITLVSNFDPKLRFDPLLKNMVQPTNTQAFFDFDAGKVSNTGGADVYLLVSCGSTCDNLLIAINGAITPAGYHATTSEPGLTGCLQLLQDNASATLGISHNAGDYSCLRTNGGDIAQILIIDNKPRGVNSELIFEYQLWHAK